jgi:hypothetical protein
MTTKVYQAQLPLSNYRIVTPRPMPRPPRPPELVNLDALAGKLRRKIETVLAEGFWYCTDCDARCDRIEGEQGQPAHCQRCGSAHIFWNPPVDQVLQPEAA